LGEAFRWLAGQLFERFFGLKEWDRDSGRLDSASIFDRRLNGGFSYGAIGGCGRTCTLAYATGSVLRCGGTAGTDMGSIIAGLGAGSHDWRRVGFE
jgi:hypothetical protein